MAVERLRRLLGLQPAADDAGPIAPHDTGADGAGVDGGPDEASAPPEAPGPAPARPAAQCPSCAFLLEPPPRSNRRCPRCRERIVVRRSEGHTVYLTEAAIQVFEAERQRAQDEQRWTAERQGWLGLARSAGAPEDARSRLEARQPSAAAVEASRTLYLRTLEQTVRSARRGKAWDDVRRLRHAQAAALYREAGSPVPPPEPVLKAHREAAAAQLRSMAVMSKYAELVGAGCCRACRADDGRSFRIADELRTPRLPHEGCPRGLCGCEWWFSMSAPERRRKPRDRRPRDAPGAT